jgi:hypothetical protein
MEDEGGCTGGCSIGTKGVAIRVLVTYISHNRRWVMAVSKMESYHMRYIPINRLSINTALLAVGGGKSATAKGTYSTTR